MWVVFQGERALFKPSQYIPPAEEPDQDYPFILTTGRILQQYHTRTMTGKSEGINRIAGSSFVRSIPKMQPNWEYQMGSR